MPAFPIPASAVRLFAFCTCVSCQLRSLPDVPDLQERLFRRSGRCVSCVRKACFALPESLFRKAEKPFPQ